MQACRPRLTIISRTSTMPNPLHAQCPHTGECLRHPRRSRRQIRCFAFAGADLVRAHVVRRPEERISPYRPLGHSVHCAHLQQCLKSLVLQIATLSTTRPPLACRFPSFPCRRRRRPSMRSRLRRRHLPRRRPLALWGRLGHLLLVARPLISRRSHRLLARCRFRRNCHRPAAHSPRFPHPTPCLRDLLPPRAPHPPIPRFALLSPSPGQLSADRSPHRPRSFPQRPRPRQVCALPRARVDISVAGQVPRRFPRRVAPHCSRLPPRRRPAGQKRPCPSPCHHLRGCTCPCPRLRL